jgi:hypothetical protein
VQRRVHVLKWDNQRLQRLAEGLFSPLHALDEALYGVAEPFWELLPPLCEMEGRRWRLGELWWAVDRPFFGQAPAR